MRKQLLNSPSDAAQNNVYKGNSVCKSPTGTSPSQGRFQAAAKVQQIAKNAPKSIGSINADLMRTLRSPIRPNTANPSYDVINHTDSDGCTWSEAGGTYDDGGGYLVNFASAWDDDNNIIYDYQWYTQW